MTLVLSATFQLQRRPPEKLTPMLDRDRSTIAAASRSTFSHILPKTNRPLRRLCTATSANASADFHPDGLTVFTFQAAVFHARIALLSARTLPTSRKNHPFFANNFPKNVKNRRNGHKRDTHDEGRSQGTLITDMHTPCSLVYVHTTPLWCGHGQILVSSRTKFYIYHLQTIRMRKLCEKTRRCGHLWCGQKARFTIRITDIP
jgi:hypothetical protein